MATVYDVVKGISQAMSNTHDGAIDEKGEPVKIGLRREKPTSIYDRRLMDGFAVKLEGNMLRLNYQTETVLKEVHGTDFEGEIDQVIENCISFLKKEYKKVTGESLSLKAVGKPTVNVRYMNRIRVWAEAHKMYEIQGLGKVDKVERKTPEEKLSDACKAWIGMKDR